MAAIRNIKGVILPCDQHEGIGIPNMCTRQIKAKINTVELRWLKLERTVNMCSSYRKVEPPQLCNFREIEIWI